MASFNDVLATQTVAPKAVCSVATWRDNLTPIDREQFDTAATNMAIPHVIVWRAMRELGYEPSWSSVQRHRTGGCKCPSPTN